MSHPRRRRLDGKVALVTGASRGLGRAIALRLADDGARVVVNYARSARQAEEVVEQIRQEGGEAIALRADVTDERQVRELVDQAASVFGDIDVVVNNATGPQPELRIEDSSWQDYQDQLDFFVKTPFHIMQAVLPGMRRRSAGSVVNIGSEVVLRGAAPFATYASAKAAMIGLTRSWASELGRDNIRINLVAPGWIPVERHTQSDTSGYQGLVPLGRMGTPEEIANTVAFLASDEASFITGQCLTVNGGLTFE
ncbi:MAG: glucose 1-dehydrogenase [Tessaracoccus sp.]